MAEGRSRSFGDESRRSSHEETFVVVFASATGGAGKTTLCSQLAVQADIVGAGPLALIDTDLHRRLTDWRNVRRLATPAVIASNPARLSDDIEALRKRHTRLVFIDTPRADIRTITGIVGQADLVIVPTPPGPRDPRELEATLKIACSVGKPMVFVVNGATAAGPIGAETDVALSRHGTVAPIVVQRRAELAASMIEGGAVAETDPGSAAASEIAELWRYLSARVNRVERRSQSLPFVGRERRVAPSAEPAGETSEGQRFTRRGAA